MNTATAALIFGVVFTLAGLAGFVASPPPPGAPALIIEHGHGLALGLFPVNTLHNIVHLLFGGLGIAAGLGAVMSAGAYFRLAAITYALLTILGLVSATQTMFGLVPIWGADVWLHGLIAIAAAYLGFAVGAPVARRV